MVLPGVETLLTLAATFVVAAVVYTITLHLAATFVLGDVSLYRALLAGPVPAFVLVVAGTVVPIELAGLLAVVADVVAIQWSYEVDRRLAIGVAIGHVVASVLLTVSVVGLATSLGLF